MKKPSLFSLLLLGFLTIAYVILPIVSAQSDFIAFLGNQIGDGEIDGDIGNEWNDAGTYTNVTISPQGTAQIWTKHDGVHLYIAARFAADSDNPWVSFLFDGTTCMEENKDGALFGHDNYNANGYSDICFNGLGEDISVDISQDGVGAISLNASNVTTVELKKPLKSGDSVGKDIEWLESETHTFILIWNSNLNGASEGNVTHTEGLLEEKTVFLASTTIPEFSGIFFTILLVAITISVLMINRKINARPVANLTS